MGSDLVVYAPRPDATPETELSAVVSAYRFILDSAQKKGARPGAPDDGTESKEDSADAPIIQD
jgi:hypothetical protein